MVRFKISAWLSFNCTKGFQRTSVSFNCSSWLAKNYVESIFGRQHNALAWSTPNTCHVYRSLISFKFLTETPRSRLKGYTQVFRLTNGFKIDKRIVHMKINGVSSCCTNRKIDKFWFTVLEFHMQFIISVVLIRI